MTRSLLSALALAVLALPACRDSTSGSTPSPDSGSVSFSYTGAVSGSYSVAGELEVESSGAPRYRSFAAAIDEFRGATHLVHLIAGRPRGGGLGDLVSMELPNPAVRTYDVTLDCDRDCTYVSFSLDAGWDTENSGIDGRHFGMDDGTVQINDVSGGRMRGTFSGSLVDEGDRLNGVANPRRIQVQNGVFDVPVFDEEQFPNLARSTDRGHVRPAARAADVRIR